MFFGEVKTGSSLGGILSSSIEIYKNKNKIKISKGTIINKDLLDLLLLNNVESKDTGELHRPHHIDLKTGMYKGRQVLNVKSKD